MCKQSFKLGKIMIDDCEALTCSRTLGIIDPIYFEKKSICMIFGCGDCFTSLIRRYLAKLKEIIILMGKRFTGKYVAIFALFFEISMPKIQNLLKN